MQGVGFFRLLIQFVSSFVPATVYHAKKIQEGIAPYSLYKLPRLLFVLKLCALIWSVQLGTRRGKSQKSWNTLFDNYATFSIQQRDETGLFFAKFGNAINGYVGHCETLLGTSVDRIALI